VLFNTLPALMETTTAMQQSGADAGPAGTIIMVVYLALLVLIFAAMWRTFSKAGQPGWAAIIPIYNVIVLLRIVGRPWWWLLLMFIPIVSLIILIIVYNDLSKAFGHGVGFTLGLIFLPFIFLPILGFGGSQYQGVARA
jgi:uncharacterized membrane protein YhaH (DUF805 family)